MLQRETKNTHDKKNACISVAHIPKKKSPHDVSHLALIDSSYPIIILFFYFYLSFFQKKTWTTVEAMSSALIVRLNGVLVHEWSKGFMFPCKGSQSSSPLKQRFIFITCFPSGCRVLTDWNITQSTLIALLCSESIHTRHPVWGSSLLNFYIHWLQGRELSDWQSDWMHEWWVFGCPTTKPFDLQTKSSSNCLTYWLTDCLSLVWY